MSKIVDSCWALEINYKGKREFVGNNPVSRCTALFRTKREAIAANKSASIEKDILDNPTGRSREWINATPVRVQIISVT